MKILYDKYKDKGFMVFAFPCNQFGNQERDSNKKIQEFIKKKNIDFPVFSKIDVNGNKQHPLYNYLKKQKSDFFGEDIKWNFTKFLCINGIPVRRYGPQSNPLSFEKDISDNFPENNIEG
jgi:glutathione peroxidase